MTVTWKPYTGKTSALGKRPSIHFPLLPTKPPMPQWRRPPDWIRRLPEDSLFRENLEFRHGFRQDAPLHEALGFTLVHSGNSVKLVRKPKPSSDSTPET